MLCAAIPTKRTQIMEERCHFSHCGFERERESEIYMRGNNIYLSGRAAQNGTHKFQIKTVNYLLITSYRKPSYNCRTHFITNNVASRETTVRNCITREKYLSVILKICRKLRYNAILNVRWRAGCRVFSTEKERKRKRGRDWEYP